MAESHGQGIEAELEDAMRSRSHRSSSSLSSWETYSEHYELQEDNKQHCNKLKYGQWNCHIYKKNGRWVLFVNDRETVLQCEAHSVSLERRNELLYIKMDGHLQEVYISEAGEAKFFEGQTNILNASLQKVEKSTKEKESVCSCQDEIPKKTKYKSFSSNSEKTHFANENKTLFEQTSNINKKTDLTSVEKDSVGKTLIGNESKAAPKHVETNRVVEEISDIYSSGVLDKVHDCDRQSSDFCSSREDDQVSELPSLDHEAVSGDINLIQKDKDVTQIQESNVVTLSTALDPKSDRNIVTQTPEHIDMPSVTSTSIPGHKDDKDADVLSLPHETRSCKIKLIKTENHWILCVENRETVLEFDVKDNVIIEIGDEKVYIQANNTRYKVTFDKIGKMTQLQETKVISASPCSEPQTGAQIPKTSGVPSVKNINASGNINKEQLDLNTIRQGYEAGTANEIIIGAKEPTDKGNVLQISQPLMERLKRGKDRDLSEGKAETALEIDDRYKVPMYFSDCDYFIKLNRILHEVKFERDGETFLVPIKEAKVIPSTAGRPGAVAEKTDDTHISDHEKKRDPFVRKADKHENVYDKEENVAKKIQRDEKVDVASPNNEKEQSRKLPKLADDGVSTFTDTFGKMEIESSHADGMFKSSFLSSGNNQCTSNDRKNNNPQDSDERKCLMYGTKDAYVNIYETAALETLTSTSRTSSSKQPDTTVTSTRPERVQSTSDTEMEKASITVMVQQKCQNVESGARPKQVAVVGQNKAATLRVENTTKNVKTSHSQRRLAPTFPAAVPRNEYGQDDKESPCSTTEKDSIVEKTDLKVTQSLAAKEESKQENEILSTGVQVKNMEHFNFLKDSKYITQLAKTNGVTIKDLQITDCQGFEITGEPHAAQKCENELKSVIGNIRSASVKLEGERNSISETKENLSQMKAEVEKTFDVSLEFSAQTASKHHPDSDLKAKPSHLTSRGLGEDDENHIQKVEKPNLVSWQFPGGYRISLRKQSVKQSSAVVHVEFTSWNGKDKQLSENVIADGMGGHTVKIKAGLPRRRERNETEELKQLFEKILEKAGEDEHNSVAFSTSETQNWTGPSFHESLFWTVWKHFKATKRYKPAFIELCNPKADEYEASNYQCHRLISTVMEREISCIKVRPLEIRVTENKLNCTKAEVLVNTTSRELMLDAGAVSHALLKTGGEGLQTDCSIYYPKGINWGEMAVTRGHGLPCKYVFHGALPPYPMQLNEVEKLTAFRQLMDSCLTTAAELGCSTIAFPVLGAGNLRYPVDLIAAEMFTSVQKFQQSYKSTRVQAVYFVVYPSDKVALKKFRQIESGLKGVAGAKKKEQAAHAEVCEQEKTDEDIVCNVVVELTGQDSAVKEAIEFTKSKWRNLHSEEQHLYIVRLPARLGQDLCFEQHGAAAKQLNDLGAAVSMTDSNYCLRAPTLQILQQSCLIVSQFSFKRYGRQVDLLSEGRIIIKIQNVSKTDFKVMEKMCWSTLDTYAKSETKVRHNGNYLEIEGNAGYADSCRTEVQKLMSYIKKLETCCISVDEHKIAKIDEIIKEVHTGKYEACILIETEKSQLRLFSKHAKMLSDLKNEILDEIKSSTIEKISMKSTKHDHQNGRQDSERSGTHLYTRQHTDNSQISIKMGSGELKVYVYEGDLLKSKVECIVNAADEYLSDNAGVAAAVANAAGPEVVRESQSHFRRYGKVPVGNAVLTTAGNLKYRCIIHAVVPNWRDYMPMNPTKLQECKLAIQSAVRKCLVEMQRHNLKSVAIPAVSSGYQGVPRDICALEYAKAVDQYLKETSRPTVEEIHFVDINPDTVAQMAQTFHDFFVNKKVVSCDHKYLSTEQKAPVMTAPLHPQKETVKNTGRSKRLKTEGANAGGTVPSYPFLYQSSTNKTIINFGSHHELQLYTGKILELKSVDIIVFREDLAGTAKSSIAQGMVEKGGPQYVSTKGTAFKVKANFGEVIVTNGGNSCFQYVFHALVHHRQHFTKDSSKWYDALRKILGVIFKKAVLFQCNDIAMPIFRIDAKQQSDLPEYAKAVVESYKKFSTENTIQRFTVHLISEDSNLTTILQSAFFHLVSDKQPVSDSSIAVYTPTDEKLVTGQTPKKEWQTAKKTAETPTKMEQLERKETLSESTPTKEEECVICLDKMTLPKKLPCGHTFCKDCISQHMKTKKHCPICGKVFGEITGNQPKGQMNIHRMRTPLPGYERCDTIVIEYVFPSGTQGPEHPEPGKPYRGIARTAYLPDNTDGRQILKLLEMAFNRHLTFTIGQSRTTGHSGVITWNDIHHKTNPQPNTQFGYPDPGYFDRVKDELAAKGVTVDDVK